MANSTAFLQFKDLASWLRTYINPWVLEPQLASYSLVTVALEYDKKIDALAKIPATWESHPALYLQAYMELIPAFAYNSVFECAITDPILILKLTQTPRLQIGIYQYDPKIVKDMTIGTDYVFLPPLKEKLNLFYSQLREAIKNTENLSTPAQAELAIIKEWITENGDLTPNPIVKEVETLSLESKLFWLISTAASAGVGAIGGIVWAATGAAGAQEHVHPTQFCGDDGTGWRCHPTQKPEHPTIEGMSYNTAGPILGACAGATLFLCAAILTRPVVKQGIKQIANNVSSSVATLLTAYRGGDRETLSDPEMGLPLLNQQRPL